MRCYDAHDCHAKVNVFDYVNVLSCWCNGGMVGIPFARRRRFIRF